MAKAPCLLGARRRGGEVLCALFSFSCLVHVQDAARGQSGQGTMHAKAKLAWPTGIDCQQSDSVSMMP